MANFELKLKEYDTKEIKEILDTSISELLTDVSDVYNFFPTVSDAVIDNTIVEIESFEQYRNEFIRQNKILIGKDENVVKMNINYKVLISKYDITSFSIGFVNDIGTDEVIYLLKDYNVHNMPIGEDIEYVNGTFSFEWDISKDSDRIKINEFSEIYISLNEISSDLKYEARKRVAFAEREFREHSIKLSPENIILWDDDIFYIDIEKIGSNFNNIAEVYFLLDKDIGMKKIMNIDIDDSDFIISKDILMRETK